MRPCAPPGGCEARAARRPRGCRWGWQREKACQWGLDPAGAPNDQRLVVEGTDDHRSRVANELLKLRISQLLQLRKGLGDARCERVRWIARWHAEEKVADFGCRTLSQCVCCEHCVCRNDCRADTC